MKARRFWDHGQGGSAAALLTPLSWLYRGGAALKRKFEPAPWRAPVPVICIGNATVGGAGKTPLALDVAARLMALGRNVHFLTRGYGGRETGPLRVDPTRHDARAVGDEALLLAASAPTWVAAKRAEGAKGAVADGAEVLVMDDGLQHGSLAKDLSILVVDGGFGFGNGHLLPAGPLRETPASALARVQAVVCIGDDETAALTRLPAMAPSSVPVLKARIAPAARAEGHDSQRYVAFAGIGRPEKFFATLRGIGVELADTVAFADHHPFSAAEMADLRRRADTAKAGLITTEKDFVRLAPDARAGIDVLVVALSWSDPGALDALLAGVVAGGGDAS